MVNTANRMPEATALYRKLGFCEVEPYCDGVLPGELFFELEL